MTNDVDLRCACGAVKGVLSNAAQHGLNRVVCYCNDCQAFARFLGRDDVMNARGGSDIAQAAPGQVCFTQGIDQLRSMRLSDKGILRWYTECCKTPAGNMLNSPKSPFVGFSVRFFALEGADLDAAIGSAQGALWGMYAIGGCPEGVPMKAPLGVILRTVFRLFSNSVRNRGSRSPFWTEDGKPISAARIMTAEERKPLYVQ